MMKQPLNVAILIFDEVEVLDFCGPFEVFSVANRETEPSAFHVYTVAESITVQTKGGLRVHRHYSLADSPTPHVVLIPGGSGVNNLLNNTVILDWITEQASEAQLVTSVCTGAILLARCGLLDGLEATTHYRCLDQLREIAPNTQVLSGQKFVDTGRVITSAGISAGIDMSLHLLSRLIGAETADRVAKRMEYNWTIERSS